MDGINYANLQYLDEHTCHQLMRSIAEAIVKIYKFDMSRHVCVTGKALKIEQDKKLSVDDFPTNTNEFLRWYQKNKLDEIPDCLIKLGKLCPKNTYPKYILRGVKVIGEFINVYYIMYEYNMEDLNMFLIFKTKTKTR